MKQLPSYEEAKAMAHNSNQNSSPWGRLGGAIIHFLGGLTHKEMCDELVRSNTLARLDALYTVQHFADQMYGYPADEWCKLMYSHICGSITRLESPVSGSSPVGESSDSPGYIEDAPYPC